MTAFGHYRGGFSHPRKVPPNLAQALEATATSKGLGKRKMNIDDSDSDNSEQEFTGPIALVS